MSHQSPYLWRKGMLSSSPTEADVQPLLHKERATSLCFQYKVIHRLLRWAQSRSRELQYNIRTVQLALLSPKGSQRGCEGTGGAWGVEKLCVFRCIKETIHFSIYFNSI